MFGNLYTWACIDHRSLLMNMSLDSPWGKKLILGSLPRNYRYFSHTCGVYYPRDKHMLYLTGDALSNTSVLNYLLQSLASTTYFRKTCYSNLNITISTTKVCY